MAWVNSPLPSPSIMTLSPVRWSLAQAAMTKGSLTEMQAIVSTPFFLMSSAAATKRGMCLALQVSVNAPGSAKATTFLPGANSYSVVIAVGPCGPIMCNVALRTLSRLAASVASPLSEQ
jgi:hypothetical protein